METRIDCDCGGRCVVCALMQLRHARAALCRGRGATVVEDPSATLEEIAAALGVTSERARQIEACALAKVKRRVEILRRTHGSVEPLFAAWGERA